MLIFRCHINLHFGCRTFQGLVRGSHKYLPQAALLLVGIIGTSGIMVLLSLDWDTLLVSCPPAKAQGKSIKNVTNRFLLSSQALVPLSPPLVPLVFYLYAFSPFPVHKIQQLFLSYIELYSMGKNSWATIKLYSNILALSPTCPVPKAQLKMVAGK